MSSFCDTYWDQKDSYLSKYDARADTTEELAQEDQGLAALVSLGSGIEALGDIVIIFDHLAEVAPDEIRPDVEAIRDSLEESIDSASEAVENPLGALTGGLMNGLTTRGSWQRLSDYVVDNCGEDAGIEQGG